jgi:predicted RNA-binding Zn ribbon-like protein
LEVILKYMDIKYESRFKTKTGWLCLDFANTADWHASANPEEKLSAYADLVRWAAETKIVSLEIAEKLIEVGEKEPVKAREILDEAIRIREVIYSIFSSKASGKHIRESDLSVLNDAIKEMMPNQKLSIDNGNFSWEWEINSNRMDSVLWPAVWSAAELLTSEASERVGRCADERCGWLFWDNSRNRSRRWCDMRDCGNRAKVRRHYKKSHEGKKELGDSTGENTG